MLPRAWSRVRRAAAPTVPTPPSRRRIVGVVWSVLAITTLLNAPKLVRLAERRPLGGARDAALRVARPIARISGALSLDQPRRRADRALGRRRVVGGDVGSPGDASGGPSLTIPPGRVPSTVALGAPVTDPGATSSTPNETALVPAATSTTTPGGGGLIVVDTTEPAPSTTSTTPVTTTTAVSTIPPTTTLVPPQPLRDPKPRIWVIGDSLVYEIGAGIATEALNRHLPQPKTESKHSTGLSRPDYFNWPARVLAGLSAIDPDVTVMMIGANDPTGMVVNGHSVGYDSNAFYPEYERRVAFVMDALGLDGRAGIWIGLPAMAKASYEKWARNMNTIVARQASVRPWMTFLDPDHVLAPTGVFTPTIMRADGSVVVVRKGDGVHLTLDGGRIVAADVLRVMLERGLGDPKKAVPPPTTRAPSSTLGDAGTVPDTAGG